jgi:hypothetical protein
LAGVKATRDGIRSTDVIQPQLELSDEDQAPRHPGVEPGRLDGGNLQI